MDFPPRSTFVQTIGENAEIFILKNKSARSSSHSRGNGELITHPEPSLGCSHSAQPCSSVPGLVPRCRAKPDPKEQPKLSDPARILNTGGRGEAFHENPLCSPAFRADKELSVEEQCV